MMILIKRFGKAAVGLLDGMRRIEGEWVNLAMGASSQPRSGLTTGLRSSRNLDLASPIEAFLVLTRWSDSQVSRLNRIVKAFRCFIPFGRN